jgi:hypothetical protein
VLAVTLPDWFDTDTARTALLATLGLTVLLALLVARFVQKLVIRFVVLAVLIAFGISLWAQRAELGDCADTCKCRLYGQDVVISDERLQQGCALRNGDTSALSGEPSSE